MSVPFGSVGFRLLDDLSGVSNACDPRNRPGYAAGDLTAFLEPMPTNNVLATDALRALLLACLSASLIGVSVVGTVLLFQ